MPNPIQVEIKNNARVTVNNDFWVTSDAISQQFSRVTQKSLFTVTNMLIYFLHSILCIWAHNSAKNNYRLPISPSIVVKDGLFWFSIVTSLQLICYWHCDVIFVDCSCTHKLEWRRSSLAVNNREYRFLTTRYSRLGMLLLLYCICLD